MPANASPSLNWIGLATIWFGGMISVPSFMIGATLISGLSYAQALLAGFTGFSIVVAFMSLESVAAVRQRQDTVTLAASGFGYLGVRWVVSLALAVSLIGWFSVQSSVAGHSFAKISQLGLDWSLSAGSASLLLGLFMMLTAVLGFRYLKWLNFLAVPCKIALVAFAMLTILRENSLQMIIDYQPKPENRLNFLTAVGLSVGFFSVAGVISPDYARHARSARDAVLGTVAGLLPVATGLAACGAAMAVVANTYDIVEIYASLGMPFLSLTVLIIANWTTNVMNAYSGGLALQQLFGWQAERRQLATVMAGVAGSLLAASGLMSDFMNFLMLLTATVPPIAGVIVCDYWFSKSYQYPQHKAYNWYGVISWSAGFSATLLVSHPLRTMLGILAAALIYYLLNIIRRPLAGAL